MRIILERYYGDWRITKSVMTVYAESQENPDGFDGSERSAPLLRCEAREPRFAQYVEAFPGCSKCCLACGVWFCKVMATEFSPMTLTVVKSPGHRSCRIVWDDLAQVRANSVLVGMSDGYELPEYRDLVRQRETFDRLTQLVYRAYVSGEPIVLEVKNQVLFTAGSESGQSENMVI